MLVYRWQNSLGHGPYNSSFWIGQNMMKEDHSKDDLHPAPTEDFPRIPPASFLYGFPSKEKAHEWFVNWESYLIKNGFELVEYDAYYVIESLSRRQLVFCEENDLQKSDVSLFVNYMNNE